MEGSQLQLVVLREHRPPPNTSIIDNAVNPDFGLWTGHLLMLQGSIHPVTLKTGQVSLTCRQHAATMLSCWTLLCQNIYRSYALPVTPLTANVNKQHVTVTNFEFSRLWNAVVEWNYLYKIQNTRLIIHLDTMKVSLQTCWQQAKKKNTFSSFNN